MQKLDVYCEPFCIKEGHQFEIHHVNYRRDQPYTCFMHFHDVHELVFFENIDGSYFYNQGETELINNDIVFTPSLETHDFELTEQEKSWHIIQFLPEFIHDSNFAQAADFFKKGAHLRLSAEHLNEIQTQLKWLLTSYTKNPHGEKSATLLKLLLLSLVEYAQPVNSQNFQPIATHRGFAKMARIIKLFRQQQYVDLSLNEAAALCFLSPSYFSRLFKRVFRCNYSEYSIQHKLYSAARLLGQSQFSITDISYELNFSSPSHFIALFKKHFSVTPHKYRVQLQHRIKN